MPLNKWNYFSESEVQGLRDEFVAQLDQARHNAGIPFVITSGLRTPEKNQSIIGAVANSAHLQGLAVDLRVSTNHDVFKIVQGAIAAGIRRIGIYVDKDFNPIHLHLDADLTKPPECIWLKQEGSL